MAGFLRHVFAFAVAWVRSLAAVSAKDKRRQRTGVCVLEPIERWLVLVAVVGLVGFILTVARMLAS
jgi:hypothetical protein